jgi:hypothetical protein
MKKIFFISPLLMAISLISCKKEKSTIQIQVTDKVTNSPVSAAIVVVYKCGVFNCNLGSIDLFSGVSDNNGNCRVPEGSYNEAAWVRVTKENYWSWDETKSTLKSMIPAGWVRMRIIKSGNYSAQAQLTISITSQSTNSSGSALFLAMTYGTPSDSSILIKCFGGESNKIDWQLSDQNTLSSGTWQQQVPRLDTIKNVMLNY